MQSEHRIHVVFSNFHPVICHPLKIACCDDHSSQVSYFSILIPLAISPDNFLTLSAPALYPQYPFYDLSSSIQTNTKQYQATPNEVQRVSFHLIFTLLVSPTPQFDERYPPPPSNLSSVSHQPIHPVDSFPRSTHGIRRRIVLQHHDGMRLRR